MSTRRSSSSKTSESGKTRKKLSKSSRTSRSNNSSEHEFIIPILSRVFGDKFLATKIQSFKNKFNVSLQNIDYGAYKSILGGPHSLNPISLRLIILFRFA